MIELKTKPSGIYYIDVHVPAEGGGYKRRRIRLDTRDKLASVRRTGGGEMLIALCH